jgi:hypothetical protein
MRTIDNSDVTTGHAEARANSGAIVVDPAPAIEPPATPPSPAPFTPVAEGQRIEALDVVRGFALLGIFLMNIEWFNVRSRHNEGMPAG